MSADDKNRKKWAVRDWLVALASLLDDAAVLGLVLLALWFFKIEITLLLIIFIALLFAAFVFIMHKAIIPSLHVKKVAGSEGLIGLEGRVVKPLTPIGVIRVQGEYWKAKSVSGDTVAGEGVEIIGISGLILEVRRKGEQNTS